jgi:repressor LexA
MQKLTQRQKMVLEFIANTIHVDGYPPTLREIGNFMGIRSTNGVNDHLRALERKGYLTRKDMKSRTLRPTPAVEKMLKSSSIRPMDEQYTDDIADDLIAIPILGRVAAGALQEAIEQPSDHVRIDRMLIGGQQRDVFGLRIRGESMIEVALVGDEATCKYFFPERDHIRLEPANHNMAAILVPKHDWRDTQLLGVVVGVYRKLAS